MVLKNTLACFLCLLHLVVQVGGTTPYVLCLGEDGHLAIEIDQGNGTCMSAQDPLLDDGQGHHFQKEEDGHCGPCLDVSVVVQTSENGSAPIKRAAAPRFSDSPPNPATSSKVAVLPSFQLHVHSRVRTPCYFNSDPTGFLQTVLLRI